MKDKTMWFFFSYFTATMINQFTVYYDSHQIIKFPGTTMGRNLLEVQVWSSLLLFKNGVHLRIIHFPVFRLTLDKSSSNCLIHIWRARESLPKSE